MVGLRRIGHIDTFNNGHQGRTTPIPLASSVESRQTAQKRPYSTCKPLCIYKHLHTILHRGATLMARTYLQASAPRHQVATASPGVVTWSPPPGRRRPTTDAIPVCALRREGLGNEGVVRALKKGVQGDGGHKTPLTRHMTCPTLINQA